MKDGKLIKHQDMWVASITLDNGQAAHEQLNTSLTDDEVKAINDLPHAERVAAIDAIIVGHTRV